LFGSRDGEGKGKQGGMGGKEEERKKRRERFSEIELLGPLCKSYVRP